MLIWFPGELIEGVSPMLNVSLSEEGRVWGPLAHKSTEDEMVGWHHRLDGHEFG